MKTKGQIAFEGYNASLATQEHLQGGGLWRAMSDDCRARWEDAASALEEAAPPAAGAFREWAVLELMGHRRFAGLVSDVELFGNRMVRIDIPSEPPATQFYGPASVYCVTPTDEATCRDFARQAAKPAPIQRWEVERTASLPAACATTEFDAEDDDDAPF